MVVPVPYIVLHGGLVVPQMVKEFGTPRKENVFSAMVGSLKKRFVAVLVLLALIPVMLIFHIVFLLVVV
jgi:hypothetical protein